MERHYPLMKGAVLRRRVGTVHAVDGISFDIREGETLGLVGESGCGKTTTMHGDPEAAKPPSGARIVVLGKDAAHAEPRRALAMRRDLQVVFQDPMASLDPRLPVGDILAEPLRAHGVAPRPTERAGPRAAAPGRAASPSTPTATRRSSPAASGSASASPARWRWSPRLLVLDEPVSALDVSIQAG